ncbi:MAG: hypothetical protein H0W78_11635 [Planctomycetes bacterium]|nr:hypothetical protein [Planctomycetota bacterium]
MRTTTLFAAFIALSLLNGCAQPPRQVTADDFQILRSYGWDTTVAEPQATWNPETYQVLARSVGGFVLLDEGAGKQQYFASRGKHETAFPVWVSARQFAFGPKDNVITTTDGRVVPTSEGLSVVTLLETITGKDAPLPPKNLTSYGYRPKVWGRNLVAASEDRIYLIDPFGTIAEFGLGFMPEPQRKGEGIAWQDRPVLETDHWIGSATRRGNLIIRWRSGITTTIPNAVEARWTSSGGVLCTVMRAEPVPGQPWWSGGTDIYHLAHAKAVPVLVAADARSPAPHPHKPACAAVGSSGALIICGFDGSFRHQIAPSGEAPAWSHDGRRLMAEEPVDGRTETRYLHVYVFKSTDDAKK